MPDQPATNYPARMLFALAVIGVLWLPYALAAYAFAAITWPIRRLKRNT